MKKLLPLLVFLSACSTSPTPPLKTLPAKEQKIINSCMTCHAPNSQVKGPNLNGLEKWYLKEQAKHFHRGVRGGSAENIKAHMMYKTIQPFKEKEVKRAAAWFAGQERTVKAGSIEGNAKKGEELYKAQCYRCHNHKIGKLFSRSPSLNKLEAWYYLEQMRNFKKGIRGKHKDDEHGIRMVEAVEKLTDQDFKDIGAYLYPAK